jgi:phosphatidate cytidylyltransferase
MTLTSHQKRLLTGLLPLPLLLWILYSGGVPFLILVIILSALGQWEFYSMFWKQENVSWKIGGIMAGTLFLLTAGLVSQVSALVVLALIFCLFGSFFLIAYSNTPESTDFREIQLLFLGCCYLPLLLHFALALAWPELLLVVAAAFISDTAAYYAGSTWGKRQIWPTVSPKKTWMGSVGGMLACVLSCLLIGGMWGVSGMAAFVTLGIVLNLGAQCGDFFESALKRSRAIKDSGVLLPGHGGLLDRIDSLLFVLPLYAAIRSVHPFFG